MQEEMLLQELIENYSPVYPEPNEWASTVDFLYAEEPNLMQELFDSLEEDGWREPIILTREDDPDYEGAFVIDGTHRVALAIAHGLITIPVQYGHDEAKDEKFLTAEITILNEESIDDDFSFELFDRIRSWRLDENNWITIDLFSGAGRNSWHAMLNFFDIAHKVAIENKLKTILEVNFPYNFKVIVKHDDDFYID